MALFYAELEKTEPPSPKEMKKNRQNRTIIFAVFPEYHQIPREHIDTVSTRVTM